MRRLQRLQNSVQIKMLLFRLCGIPKLQYVAATTHTNAAKEFNEIVDGNVTKTLSSLLGLSSLLPKDKMRQARLPIRMGGLGLQSLVDTQAASYLSSVANPSTAQAVEAILEDLDQDFPQDVQGQGPIRRSDGVAGGSFKRHSSLYG